MMVLYAWLPTFMLGSVLWAVTAAAGSQQVNPLLPSTAPTNPHELILWKLITAHPPEQRMDPPADFPHVVRQTINGLRIAIITAWAGGFDPSTHPGYAIARTGWRCYALQHNYTYVVDEHAAAAGLTHGSHWAKMYAVARNLRFFDWVAWVDADVMLKQTAVKLETFVDDNYDVIVADDANGNNNGIFFLRRSAWGYYFLHRWFQQRLQIDVVQDNGPWMEALLHVAHKSYNKHYSGECVREGGGVMIRNFQGYLSCYARTLSKIAGGLGHRRHNHVKFVYGRPHCGFNSGHGWAGANRYRPGCFLVHFAGMSGKERGPMVQAAKQAWRSGRCEVKPASSSTQVPG